MKRNIKDLVKNNTAGMGSMMTLQEIDQEEHRLAALGAGIKVFIGPASSNVYDRDTFYISEDDSFFGMCKSWNPKTNKADAFDLYAAIYRDLEINISKYSRLRTLLNDSLMAGDISLTCETVFKCAVEIGRLSEV